MASSSSPTLPEFEYRPLPAEGWFRCLFLYPNSNTSTDEEAPIECELVQFAPTTPSTQYVALSYTWGGQPRDHTIICGHGFGKPRHTLKVTKNCHDILVALRRALRLHDQQDMLGLGQVGADIVHNFGLFWIDQICIDQDSHQDRNLSVANMGNIYRNAAFVLIWLGLPPVDSNTATPVTPGITRDTNDEVERFLLDVAADTTITGKSVGETKGVLRELGHHRIEWTPTWNQNLRSRYLSGIQQALGRNPWFFRMWTFQEYNLARGPTALLLSSSIMSINIFIREISVTGRFGHPFTWDDLAIVPFLAKDQHEATVVSWGSHICSVLWRCINRDCSDRRDKIFAIRSVLDLIRERRKKLILSEPASSTSLKSAINDTDGAIFSTQPPVDYSKPVTEVYTDWTAWAITDAGCNLLLYLAPRAHSEEHILSNRNKQSPPDGILKLPSWVPDYANLAHLHRNSDINTWMRVSQEPPQAFQDEIDDFSASGPTSSSARYRPRRGSASAGSSNSLFLTGRLLASETIRHLSGEFPPLERIPMLKSQVTQEGIDTITGQDAGNGDENGQVMMETISRWMEVPWRFYWEITTCTAVDGNTGVNMDHATNPFTGLKYLPKKESATLWDIFRDLPRPRPSTSTGDDRDQKKDAAQEEGEDGDFADGLSFSVPTNPSPKGNSFENLRRAMRWTHRCHLLQTATGRYGFGFGSMLEGDVCAAVAGMTRMLVLRPVTAMTELTSSSLLKGKDKENIRYRLVGHAYINGLMHGEMWPGDGQGELLEEIELI